MTECIRVATRGSDQARAQARTIADALSASGVDCELVIVDTHGDRTQAAQVPLHTIGGQGAFTKEIQVAVLDGRADVAVHSAKDLPTATPDGLVIGAFGVRRDPRDALIGRSLAALAHGATVASGSVRRRSQLGLVRPDLHFVELRGNIPTRLERIPDDGAIVMAVAALEVLGRTDEIAEILDPTVFVPAVGQGCVAVECRSGDAATIAALGAIDDANARSAVMVERAYLGQLGSGCSSPVAAYATEGELHLYLDGPLGVHREVMSLTGELTLDMARARDAADRARVAAGV
jgi:hydroxymethylbilane synthase